MIQGIPAMRENDVEIIEKLRTIWQRVLRKPSIEADSNFFDLGGDPWSAIRLFSEIATAFGRELSPVHIYHRPTLASLAEVLLDPRQLALPALTPLKTGDNGPALFLVHGCGSTVLEFAKLVPHIVSPCAIYGMQARGTDGAEKPFDHIEDLAHYHFEAIKTVQPRGPYLLTGYSSGGLAALEIARNLLEMGEQVALLALMDSYPPLRRLRLSHFVKLKLIRRQHYLLNYVSALLNALRGRKAASAPSIPVPLSAAMRRFQKQDMQTLERYKPRFYNGTIRFIRAQDGWDFPLDPEAVWGPLVKELLADNVPGDHQGIVTTHYKAVAAVLSNHLRAARNRCWRA